MEIALICSTPDCGNSLGRRNKSGLCRSCAARRTFTNPANRAKCIDGLRKYLADPSNRAAHIARSAAHLAAWRSTPEGAAAIREQALSHLDKARAFDSKERVRRIRAGCHPGIPEHRWDEVVALTRHMPADEARRAVLEDEARIERRRVAALTPFERQLEAVRNGAALTERVAVPSRRPTHVVGGSSLGDLS